MENFASNTQILEHSMKSLLTFLFLSLALTVTAQTGGGTTDKKAENHYLEGMQHLKFGRYEQAEIQFQKAIERDPEYLDPRFDLSFLYIQTKQLDRAKDLMEWIVNKNPTYSPNLLLNLGLMEQEAFNYEKALSYFDKYLKIAPPESSNYQTARVGAANCEFAMWAKAHPVEFTLTNLGEAINSKYDEYFPAMTADEQTLIFTRAVTIDRHDGYANDFNEDFYFSFKDENGNWQKAINPRGPINTPLNEGAPTLSPDGIYVIFTACDLDRSGNYGPDKKGYGRCDLFVSVRNGNEWSKPVNMGPTINSKHWESQPSFASDGKTIYFTRGKYDREHKQHDDLYLTELVNGKWSEAEALPLNINTSGKEESVFIHPDNRTLYFSSNGHAGMGGMDIFMSRKKDDGTWSDPVNLGYPINTSGNENSFHVSASGEYAIIASDREGGLGGMDLYRLELPENLRPNKITYLKGVITDASTNKPLEASFRLIDLNSNDTVVFSVSDRENGSFLVVLPASEEYALIAEKNGYLYHSETFALDLSKSTTHFEKNIALQPIATGSKVVLKNVFFDVDKFELKPKSTTELNKLVETLKANPEIKIEISGHTDNQGNAAANKTLSLNRAKAVNDFLVRSGISQDRLAYKGFGQEQPIASNDTEDGRQLNRRTEVKVVE
jgi:outer membrane protein OmpA-like peptidoglycan-associated protein